MFNKELFDRLCHENGVRMIKSDNPVLRDGGQIINVTRDNIKNIFFPEEISFMYYNDRQKKKESNEYILEEYLLAI